MIVIVDYGSGNLRSVAKAASRAGAAPVEIADAAAGLHKASHIILPGVGAFGDCMRGLQAIPGMVAALEEAVLHRKKPLLGICVGMQMLFEQGREHGAHKGLGWLKGEIAPLPPGLKIPHMGWNELQVRKKHPLLAGIENGAHAYFVHGYHAQCANPDDVIATAEYGQTLAAVVGQGNIMGTQFHPEKSQETGLRLLKNFIFS